MEKKAATADTTERRSSDASENIFMGQYTYSLVYVVSSILIKGHGDIEREKEKERGSSFTLSA